MRLLHPGSPMHAFQAESALGHLSQAIRPVLVVPIIGPDRMTAAFLPTESAFREIRNMRPQNIAVVGATGAVGVEILRVLERRNFPVASLRLLASKRSVGKTLEFKGRPHTVE